MQEERPGSGVGGQSCSEYRLQVGPRVLRRSRLDCGTGILPVRLCGIGIPRLRGGKLVPMIHGLEGDPNAEGSPTGDSSPVGTQLCVGDPKPTPR
jgi:hypothetical protein